MYPHVFPLHWLKTTCKIFNTPHYFVGLMKNGTGGTLWLEMVGGKAYGGGKRFSSGWRYSQGHHVNKAGKFLYLEEKQLHKA